MRKITLQRLWRATAVLCLLALIASGSLPICCACYADEGETEQLQKTLEDHDEAIEKYVGLIYQEGKSEYTDELASRHMYRGETNLALGRVEAAMADSNRATDLYRYLVARRGERAFIENLAASYKLRSKCLIQMGRLQEAVDSSGRSVEMLTKAMENGTLSHMNLSLAEAVSVRADALAKLGQPAPRHVAVFMQGDVSEVLVRPYLQSQVHPVIVPPRGEFAGIDVAATNAMVSRLLGSDRSSVTAALLTVRMTPGNYAPAAIYAAAAVTFQMGNTEEAVSWLHVARLRATSDAMKCTDSSATGAVGVLDRYFGEPILEFAALDAERHAATVRSVVEWDRRQARHYDPRWIALHSQAAFGGTTVPFAPADKWFEIDERCRTEYLERFTNRRRS